MTPRSTPSAPLVRRLATTAGAALLVVSFAATGVAGVGTGVASAAAAPATSPSASTHASTATPHPAGATTTRRPRAARPAMTAGHALARAQARPAVPRGARLVGGVKDTTPVSGAIGLVGRDPSGLSTYATEVNTPGSALYHRFLTPATFRARFGPSVQTVAAVSAQLREAGLTVGTPSANGMLVPFRAPAATVASAFHTRLASYRLASGRTAYANTSAAELPAAIAGSVQSVLGLNDLVTPTAPPSSTGHARGLDAATPAAIAGAPQACAAAKSAAASFGSLTYTQLAHSYGLDPLYRDGDFGQGQTIALFEQDGFSMSDLSTFDTCYFGAAKAQQMLGNVSVHNVNGGYPQNVAGEAQLDVEDVSVIAPQAKIQVWEAPATYADGFVEESAMVDADQAQFLSESYGSCEPELEATYPGVLQLENTLFEQAAAQGETFMSSSADNGSDTCSADSGKTVNPLLSVSDPASQPFVMGVGGTAITAAGDPPAEEVWNDGSVAGAGGGGISAVWPETSWQSGDPVPGLDSPSIISKAESVNGNDFCNDNAAYAGQDCREVPDVSLGASPNTGGIVIYLQGSWVGFGGTSSSSPLWAAILADINSQSSCQADPLGFVVPKLYALASEPATYAADFNDVTVGNNDNFGAAQGLFPATTGYDMATGLGTPKVTGAGGAPGLAASLCGGSATTPAVSVTNVAPDTLPAAGGTVTVTGTGFGTRHSSLVRTVSIGAVTLPASAVDVVDATTLKVMAPSAAEEAGTGSATDGNGSYAVSVTVTGGATSAPSQAALIHYLGSAASVPGAPSVVGVDPSGGIESGGTLIHVYGQGFDQPGNPVTSVTVGGAAATDVTVVDGHELTALTPAYTPSACLAGDDPTTDVCQTQVQVVTKAGTSRTATIVPEFHGTLPAHQKSSDGLVPVTTEFDYAPSPTLTGISLKHGAKAAGEQGGDVVTLTGTGLSALVFNVVTVGPPNTAAPITVPISFGPDGTSLSFAAPAEPPTSAPVTLPVSVQTFASALRGGAASSVPPANDDEPLTYAPTPAVTSISTGTTPVAGPTSGGQLLTINGTGFEFAKTVKLYDPNLGGGIVTRSSDIVSATATQIQIRTPAAITGAYHAEVCNPSGCSAPSKQTYIYYLPGDPSLTSVRPTTAHPGDRLTVHGQNLGWLTAVYIGKYKATTFSNMPKGYDGFESGSTTTFTVTVPKAARGKDLPITVTTVESQATGYGRSPVNPKVAVTIVP